MAKRGRKRMALVDQVKDDWKVVLEKGNIVYCECTKCQNIVAFNRCKFTYKAASLGKCRRCDLVNLQNLKAINAEKKKQLKEENNKPDERALDIIKCIESTKVTLEELGKKYGITRERVRQIYKKFTGKARNAPHRWERLIGKQYGIHTVKSYDETKERYVVECPNGHSKRCYVTYLSQLKHFNRQCQQCITGASKFRERDEAIYKYFTEGMMLKDIAEKFNMQAGTVAAVIRRKYPDYKRRRVNKPKVVKAPEVTRLEENSNETVLL